MRSFLSPGEINYRRHRGRHVTRAFEVGVNPDLLHLVKHTGKKNPRWRCHVCQQQCYDASDYKKHLYSPRHIDAQEFSTKEELLEMNSKEFEVNFLNRLEKTESINMNPHIIYEEMVKSTRHVKIEETKWKSMDEFLEHLKTTGKALYKMTESGPTVRHGAPPPKILLATTQGGFQYDEDQDLRKLVKKATKEDDQKEEKKKSKEFKKPMPLIRKKDGETKVQFSLNGNSMDNKNTTTSSLKRKQTPGKKLNVQKKAKRQGWLEEGLVVKCLNKVIGNGKYYKKKGLVINIRDPHSKKKFNYV